jgi:hypothetical protein
MALGWSGAPCSQVDGREWMWLDARATALLLLMKTQKTHQEGVTSLQRHDPGPEAWSQRTPRLKPGGL